MAGVVIARLAAVLAALMAAPALAQAPVKPFGVVSAADGTGRWPAIAEYRADLPEHTIYRPATRPKAGLPLILWGNGACRDNGLQHAQFLREVASHGYVVIALGRARAERPIEPPSAEAATAPPSAPRATVDETKLGQMQAALDWGTRKGGPLARWIDAGKVAVMGHSCGGLQTIAMSADPRVDTSMIFNSGVYNRQGVDTRSSIIVAKEALKALHGPVAYFLGGPGDIAYANARDDFDRIDHIPVFFGEMPVGHSGTFWTDAHGGDWAKVAVLWLDWTLKKDSRAGRAFAGKSCTLCTDPRWKVMRKKL